MSFVKKTILLNNNQNEIAVLNIFKDGDSTFGAIKHVGVNSENLVLGVSVNNTQVLKQKLLLENGTYNFKFNNSFNINSNIGCVIARLTGNKAEPVLWGNNDDIVDYKSVVLDWLEKDAGTNPKKSESCEIRVASNKNEEIESEKLEKLKKTNLSELTKIEEELKGEEKEIEGGKISSEEMFGESSVDDVIKKEMEDNGDFFDMISEQIDDLFQSNPREENLEKIIPNSKWIKVCFEENSSQYVIGLVYEQGILKYVCYGVPGKKDLNSLSNIEEFTQWIPKDAEIEDGDGYWVIFQDAKTGESVKYWNIKLNTLLTFGL